MKVAQTGGVISEAVSTILLQGRMIPDFYTSTEPKAKIPAAKAEP